MGREVRDWVLVGGVGDARGAMEYDIGMREDLLVLA